MVTFKPWLFNRTPKEAQTIPFPREETTPPVMNMCLVLDVGKL